MSDKTPTVIWGAANIATAIGLASARQAFDRLEKGLIPGARKFGERWALNLDVFHASFSEPKDRA